MEQRKLPTITQIVSGELTQEEKQDLTNIVLNQEPPALWCKQHPMAKNVKYIPIDKIEYMLTRIFKKWHVEIRAVTTIANSAVVTVRLYYQCPITKEELWQDGVGAAPIHTSKGSGAMDWNAVLTDSVMKAVPAAESYAIKDAAEKIGRIFGKDLNRKDLLVYSDDNALKKFENATITEK